MILQWIDAASDDLNARARIPCDVGRCCRRIENRRSRTRSSSLLQVYNTLGYDFLEHIYNAALERELLARGHCVAHEVLVRVFYEQEELSSQRIDMIVDERVVVERASGNY